jgi:hypothetical protein
MARLTSWQIAGTGSPALPTRVIFIDDGSGSYTRHDTTAETKKEPSRLLLFA